VPIQRPRIANGLLRITPIGVIFLDEHAILQRRLAQALGAEGHLEKYTPLIITTVAVEAIGAQTRRDRTLE